jgi:hypothetical protein
MDMPVVGRTRALDELTRLASQVTAGGGALVLVSGEAGIGKTTMLSCLAELAGAAGIPVLAGRAVPEEGAPAFWPWLRVLAQGRRLGLSPASLELRDGAARRRGSSRSSARRWRWSPRRRRPDCWSRSMTCSGPTTRRCSCCATCARSCPVRGCSSPWRPGMDRSTLA